MANKRLGLGADKAPANTFIAGAKAKELRYIAGAV
jgi:hypothetical protein